MNPFPGHTAAGLTLAAVAVALLSACSSSPDDTAAAGGSDFAAYQECMADQGVTLPSGGPGAPPAGAPTDRPNGAPSDLPSGVPSPGAGGPGMQVPDGVDADTLAAAQEACTSLLPSGGPSGAPGAMGGSRGTAPDLSALTAYRSCLGDHGVTSTDVPVEQLDTSDAVVAAAVEACAPLRPSPPPSPAPSASQG